MKSYMTENEFGAGEVRSWASIIDDNYKGIGLRRKK